MIVNSNEMNEIIKENSNLIYSICKKYKDYADIEDLYQEGTKAIIKAIKTYDPSLGSKFSTYAYSFILGEISDFVRKNKALKLSKDMIRLGRKINEYNQKHYEVRGYYPTVGDIASILEISEAKVIEILDMLSNKKVRSLDEEINSKDKEMTLLDVTAKKEMIDNDMMLDLKEAFSYLSDEEKKLVINRYYNNLTQSEVASLMGVNQVYVSRLEKKALTKMKSRMVA